MKKQQICILGSTGSIGTQALDVIEQHSDLYEVYCLTANNRVKELCRAYTYLLVVVSPGIRHRQHRCTANCSRSMLASSHDESCGQHQDGIADKRKNNECLVCISVEITLTNSEQVDKNHLRHIRDKQTL